jgi:hypothetical protein
MKEKKIFRKTGAILESLAVFHTSLFPVLFTGVDQTVKQFLYRPGQAINIPGG